jgi:hypothetical protein
MGHYEAGNVNGDIRMGCRSAGGDQFELFFQRTAGVNEDRFGTWGATGNTAGSTTGYVPGHFYFQRSSATSRVLYKDATSIFSNTTNDAATGASDSNIYIGASNNNGTPIYSIGINTATYLTNGEMTAQEITDFNIDIINYLLVPTGRIVFAVGAVVGMPKVWLDASRLTLADNDPISTWTDLSGSGFSPTAAGAARPTLKTNVLNSSRSVARFAGAQVMATTGVPTTSTAYTMFFVGKTTLPTTQQAYTYNGNPAANGYGMYNYTSKYAILHGGHNIGAGSASTSNFVVLSMPFTALYLNGTPSVSIAGGITAPGTAMYIGAGAAADYLTGDVAVVILFPVTLGTLHRQLIEDYLSYISGISVTH